MSIVARDLATPEFAKIDVSAEKLKANLLSLDKTAAGTGKALGAAGTEGAAGFAKADAAAAKSAGAAKAAAAEWTTTSKTVSGAGDAATTFSQKYEKTGTRLKSTGAGMTKALSLPIIGLTALAGKFSVEFDKSMRNVDSIAQLPEDQFKKLESSVLSLSGKTAQAPVTLANGLYDLVSSGFDAKDAMTVLESSAKGATAGLTTTEVSTGAVAAVLNAYHLKAKDAADVTDSLFQTVNLGVVSFEQLATTIGDVLPFASQMGVNIDGVGAAISQMTKEGISAPESMTRIKAIMVSMLKPSNALKDAYKELGVASGDELIKKMGGGRVGMQRSLEAIVNTTLTTKDLNKAYKQLGATSWDTLVKKSGGVSQANKKLAETLMGSSTEIAKLFPNVRALGGALALTGGNTKSAEQMLGGFQKKAGAVDRTLSKQEKSVAVKYQKLTSTWQALAIQVGPPLISFLGKLTTALTKVAEWFSKLPGPVKTVILYVGLLVAGLGPLLWIMGSLISNATTVAKAIKLMGTAFMTAAPKVMTAATEIGLAEVVAFGPWVIAIGIIIGLLAYLITHWKGTKQTISMYAHAIAKAVTVAFNAVKGVIVSVFNFIKNFLIKAWDKITGVFSDAIGWIKSHITTIMRVILAIFTGGFSELIILVVQHWHQITGVFSSVGNWIKTALKDVGQIIAAPFIWAYNKVKWAVDHIKDLWGDIKGVGGDILSLPGKGVSAVTSLFADGGVVGPGAGGPQLFVAGEGGKQEWVISQEGDRQSNIGYALDALSSLGVEMFAGGGKPHHKKNKQHKKAKKQHKTTAWQKARDATKHKLHALSQEQTGAENAYSNMERMYGISGGETTPAEYDKLIAQKRKDEAIVRKKMRLSSGSQYRDLANTLRGLEIDIKDLQAQKKDSIQQMHQDKMQAALDAVADTPYDAQIASLQTEDAVDQAMGIDDTGVLGQLKALYMDKLGLLQSRLAQGGSADRISALQQAIQDTAGQISGLNSGNSDTGAASNAVGVQMAAYNSGLANLLSQYSNNIQQRPATQHTWHVQLQSPPDDPHALTREMQVMANAYI